MFRFLQKGSYMSRNRGLLIYLEALIQRGKIGIDAARQLRSYASGGHSSYQCLTNVDNRLRNKCAMTWNSDMEENNFTDMVYSLFTTHHSLIFNDTDFSRFTSHFSLKSPLIQTLHPRTAYLPNLTCNGTFIYTRQINITSTIA